MDKLFSRAEGSGDIRLSYTLNIVYKCTLLHFLNPERSTRRDRPPLPYAGFRGSGSATPLRVGSCRFQVPGSRFYGRAIGALDFFEFMPRCPGSAPPLRGFRGSEVPGSAAGP